MTREKKKTKITIVSQEGGGGGVRRGKVTTARMILRMYDIQRLLKDEKKKKQVSFAYASKETGINNGNRGGHTLE